MLNIIPFYTTHKYKNIFIWFYFILFYIPNFIDTIHIFLFSGEIDYLSVKAVFNTNIKETTEFFSNFLNLKLIIFILSEIIVSIILLVHSLKSKIYKKFPKLILLFYILGMVLANCIYYKYKPTLSRIIEFYINYYNEKLFNEKCFRERKGFSYGEIRSLISEKYPQTYVVVIGESATRVHMSLYGYSRKTNPYLNKIKENLYLFDKVSSAHCSTLAVLKEALTFDKFSNGDIISFLKQAGFKTFWLSIQVNSGRFDNEIAIIANQADYCLFITQRYFSSFNGYCFDELLFEPFKKALNDPAYKKVIFLHLLGSHSTYVNRYPKNFELFHDNSNIIRKTISEYDNSIVYTDYILYKFIDMLNKKNENSCLLYFSDHGEDVRDTQDCIFFHSDTLASPMMFSIPFIIWLSENYKKTNAKFISKWNLHKVYKTNTLIHSIMILFRLANKNIKVENSIFEESI